MNPSRVDLITCELLALAPVCYHDVMSLGDVRCVFPEKSAIFDS